MAQINKQKLKDYFRRGNKPTESQFEDLIDSNINVVSSKITIDNDLNIGLDVDNPQAKLHVNGSLQLEQKTDYTGAKGTVRWTGSDLVVKTENEDTSDSWKSLVDTSGTVSIDEYNNRIGIGLTEQSPLSRLHLNGPVRIDNPTEHINKAMLNVLGNVGIGTDQPKSNLHIAATYNQALSGTVTGTQGDTKLTGTATQFTSELDEEQKIQISTHSYTISSITDDTNLTLNEALVENATDATVYIAGDLLKVQDINNTTSLAIDKNGNVGIGTNDPKSKLSVVGGTARAGESAGEYTEIGHGGLHGFINTVGSGNLDFRHDQSTKMSLRSNGNVGIGTTIPKAKLEVNGNTSLGGDLDVTGATSLATTSGAVNIASSGAMTTVKGTLNVDKAVTLDTTLNVTGDTGLDGNFKIANDKFTVASSTGNTVTKGSLTVKGDIDAQSNLVISGNLTVNGTTTTTNSTTVTINDPVLTLGGDTAPSADDSKDRGIEFKYYDDQARVGFFGFDKSAKEFTFLTDATNSSEVFSGTDGALRVGSLSVSGTGDSSFNGNVGIGTDNPKAPLSISGDGKEKNPDGSMHITSDCILFGGNNSGKQTDSAQISAGLHQSNSLCIVGMSSGTSHTDRKIRMWAEGGLTISGSVGIGTTSPSVKLEVNGTVKATSFEGNGASLTNLNASEITGQITLDHLPQEIKNLLPPRIGEEIHGGIVFATGLVCATSDQNTGNWETCKTSCENYNGGGYSDWRMPTKAELNLIYENLHQSNIGGFASAWYWAYAENTTNSAWNQNFVNGYQNYGYKYYAGRVRAVRAF